MTVDEKIAKDMKEAIIKSKELHYTASNFYWLAQLDYSRKDSHVEHQILQNKVKEDLEQIKHARYIINSYERLGVNFEDFL